MLATGAGDATPEADGRRRRSERSRGHILESLAEALRDPLLEVTAETVASKAGLSVSTVFRHFGDMEQLAAAMRERISAQVFPILAAPFEGGRRARVKALVARRASILEIVAALDRASERGRLRDAEDRKMSDIMTKAFRAQMTAALGPELDRDDGEALTLAIDALLSPDTWLHMRRRQGLEPSAAEAVLEKAILSLVGARK